MKLHNFVISLAILAAAGCGGQILDNSGLGTSTSSSSSSGGASSSSGGPVKPNEDVLAVLQVQRSLWQSHNISEYEVGLSARYGNSQRLSVILHVKDGEILSVRQRDINDISPVDKETPGLTTIAETFESIEADAMIGIYQISIEYDSVYGFPVSVRRDYRSDWYDDEDEWSFVDFKAIQ